MLNLITVSIGLFLIILIGWTFTTYVIKKDSQKIIREELTNLLGIWTKFFLSLGKLIRILANNSLSSKESETTPVEKNISKENEQLLNLAKPFNEIKEESIEVKNDDDDDDDDALSSFSPEVIELINEEEERVA